MKNDCYFLLEDWQYIFFDNYLKDLTVIDGEALFNWFSLARPTIRISGAKFLSFHD